VEAGNRTHSSYEPRTDMTDFADYRLDFTPAEQLGRADAPPADWRRHDQLIRTVAATVMKPDQTTLDRLLSGKVLRIPEYQRDYSWEEQNWEPLWNDIIAVTQARLGQGIKGQDVFFGIVFVAESDQPAIDYDIIDGQQRLTTIGLIVRALQSRMEAIPDADITEASCRQYQQAFFRKADAYLFRDFGEYGFRKPRLVLDEVNRREYLLVVSADDDRPRVLQQFERAHGNTRRNAIKSKRLLDLLGAGFELPDEIPTNLRVPESSKLLLHGYRFFCKRMDRELEEFTADQRVRLLANLLDYIMHCLSITVFRLNREHPELLMDVFEVLNNRGMELALTDVVNARIVQRFSAADASDGRRRIHQWRKTMNQFGRHFESLRDFLVDYLTSKYPEKGSRAFHADRLLEAFSHQEPPDDGKVHELPLLHDIGVAEQTLDKLESGAPLYAYLIDASGETRDFGDERSNERIRDGLRRLQALQTRQWRALVLTYGLAVEDAPAVERASWLACLIDAIERLAIRQSICGVNPNRLEEVYRKAIARFLENGFDEFAVDQLWSDFRSEYGELVQGESFINALVRKDNWGNNLSKVLLWRTFAAQHAENAMVIRRLNTSEIHLEHVMPQAPYFDNVDDQPWLAGMFAGTETYRAVEAIVKDDADKRDSFLEDVVALLVRDIGNAILLKDTVNKSISNTTLAWKLVSYEATPGFQEIDVNAPFSVWQWTTTQLELHNRIEKYLKFKFGRLGSADVRDGLSTVDEEMEALMVEIEGDSAKSEVDLAWTAARLADRRAAILTIALSNLQLPGENLATLFREDAARDVVHARIEAIVARFGGA